MAGAATLRERWARWWGAPSTLELLVGPEHYVRTTFRAFARFGLVAMPGTLLTIALATHGRGLALPWFGVTSTATLLSWRYGASREERVSVGALYLVVLVVATLIGGLIGLFDGDDVVIVTVVPAATAVASVWVPRRWAAVAVVAGCASYTATLVLRGAPHLALRLVAVVGLAWAVLIEVTNLLDRVRHLAERERAARDEVTAARDELAELNRTLEHRVAEQVEEIAGLGRLRSFLPPQVADAVVAADGEGGGGPLAPHRRQIAVVFADLRGFTVFSNTSQPEEVLDVLEAYYAVVGGFVRDYDATVGSFLGDGVMAYFNDPVPCEDPAGLAVAMASDLRAALEQLCAGWERRGWDLGFGVGVSFGYATLGTIGFEGRSEYTPLGSVVNLASRLSREARRGEVLLDGRAYTAVSGRVVAEERRLDVPGFDRGVVAFALQAVEGLVPN
jgi:class 3 adenylate cyclase